MTWSWPLADTTYANTGEHDSIFALPASANSYLCRLLDGRFQTCYHHSTFTETEMAPIDLALATLPDIYDWYVVTVAVGFPTAPRAHEACYDPPGVFGQGCKTQTAGDSNGFLSGVTIKNTSTGTAIDNTGGSPGLGASWDINSGLYGSLVNPSPTYPIPDTHGNEAGELLWTRAQIEALGVPFIYGGHWGHGSPNGDIQVSIGAYNNVSAPRTHPPFMCLL